MASRKEIIKKGVCSWIFTVADNPNASEAAPWYESAHFSQVNTYSAIIDKVAAEKNVEARLIRAIMFMETTHGYYDGLISWTGTNKSILPMNINVDYWGNTFGTRSELLKPENNIRAGAEMLYRIQANMTGAPVEKIATLYNNINATVVNDYGMRVKKIYDNQPWDQ